MTTRPLKIGVLGPHQCTDEDLRVGAKVGEGIARNGGVLVCGGLGGMMQAAAEGAKRAGGQTLGILPGEDATDANPFIDTALTTGLGPLRNALVVRTCDAVIAIRGAYGTLSEIAFALRLGIPVVGLKTWSLIRDGNVDDGIHAVESAEEAVKLAFELARGARANIESA